MIPDAAQKQSLSSLIGLPRSERASRSGRRSPEWKRVLGQLWAENERLREEIARVRKKTARQAWLRRVNAQLKRAATTDGLTGLANRRAFDQIFVREVRRAQRSGKPISVLLLDLDGFKWVNDRHGHLAGDDALQRVAAVLKESVREGDLLFRFGGDELIVLMPGTAERPGRVIAELLRTTLKEKTGLSASFGLATLQNPKETPSRLLRRADNAMYASKRGRRARAQSVSEG